MEERRAQILEQVFGNTVFKIDKLQVCVFCPNGCHEIKRKLEINVQKNIYHCWVCGDSGSIFKLLKKYASNEERKSYYKTLNFQVNEENFENTKVDLPTEYQFLFNALNTPVGRFAYKVLKEQWKLDDISILRYKIGVCNTGKYHDRIIFPSFNALGDVNYFITRTLLDGEEKKYIDCEVRKSTIIFNELLIDWTKPIIIVEGVKSQLKHKKIPNIIPILGSSCLYEDHKLFQEIILNDCKKVYIALDSDARVKATETMKKLYSYNIEAKYVDLGDFEQPDEMNTVEFIERLSNAKSFDESDYLISRIMSL